ncbi:MAG: penicillin-binding protein 2 [Actinobacteria bacterium 13_2_20CM_2_66_6]|nr:MAG: penicillin-binding protein 2 [Actinobacteria bacterium 13_2_20CM_2_66_6]
MIERGRWLVLGGSSARQRWSFQLVALGLLAVVSLSVLAVKLAELQVSEGSSLAALARLNSVHRVVLEAERGIIYDRHGVALVQNAPAWNLEVIPAALALTTPARIAELTELARLSGIPEDELVVSIQNADSYGSLRLGPNLTEAQQLAINERLPGLPGVTIRRHAVRTYMNSMVLGHVIGYVGPIDEVEIKSLRKLGYQPDELVGKVGVEAGLESRLRGVDGWADVVVDARGQVVRTLASHSPIPGSSVYLSLDLKLELATAAALAAGLRRDHKTAGASVVVDPRSGEVLAMVSIPGYDTNLFTHGISRADYARLTTDPNRPLLNRAIAGQYAPGSTFKMVTATAGLQEGLIRPDTLLSCPSYLSYGGWVYHNWASYSLGYMNVAKALAVSCDTFFYQVAARVGDVTLARYARAYGFGTAKQIEMPGVQPGLVPDRIWKQLSCGVPDLNSDLCRWTLGDTVTFGIGQSALLTTPLNQAVYVAAIANGGKVLQPTLVHMIRNAAGHVTFTQKTQVINTVPVSPGNLAVVREGMREEINRPYHMNYWFVHAGVPADGGGKTGTAQWGGSGLDLPTHAWFVFFAPFAQPYVAMSIFVERGELSEVEAAPIGVDIMRYFRGHRSAIEPAILP